MKMRGLLFFIVFSLSAKKPIGLEWRDNCCSYAAAIQLLYGLTVFRDFVLTNKSLIENKAPGTTIAALLGIFLRIKDAEDTGQEMVSYEDLKPFYEKFGLRGQFSDAFTDVLAPLIGTINDEFLKYLQNLWPEFKKLWVIEFKYEDSPPEYRTLSPIHRAGVVDEASDRAISTIIVPRYQFMYGGRLTGRYPLALSISPYDQLSGIGQIAVVPRGSYDLVGAFRVFGAHVAAIRNDGVWYLCDGKSVKAVSLDELQTDYQNLSWRFYEHDPVVSGLRDIAESFADLAKKLP